ncbi:MAG: response regulator transcription factor [Acidobacteriia bacterium]|nr:response regulator transcription factor [Terriglobia bacterium]
MPRILIADDNSNVRRALRALLEEDADWIVCGEAIDGGDAVVRAHNMKPDLIILDFQMPVMNGLQAAREIAKENPETPVLLCSAHLSTALLGEARRAGIRGAVSKSTSTEIIDGVRTLLRRECFFPQVS